MFIIALSSFLYRFEGGTNHHAWELISFFISYLICTFSFPIGYNFFCVCVFSGAPKSQAEYLKQKQKKNNQYTEKKPFIYFILLKTNREKDSHEIQARHIQITSFTNNKMNCRRQRWRTKQYKRSLYF